MEEAYKVAIANSVPEVYCSQFAVAINLYIIHFVAGPNVLWVQLNNNDLGVPSRKSYIFL